LAVDDNMVHRKLRTNPLRHLNDNLGEKQELNNGLWVLVDKPYYCDSIRYKFETSTAYQETD
jgi:hypothetical protein